ncbi:acyl-CoA N-acyltransferase [Zopfia rhizophila CBS 207.26]|uniref:Acyl-CoA N-acyltransferase n=1 Tax=Zopfia rhizophila CBS 207.26 TaxID=1314779 RepID=A0A6A6DBM9_9PEZI|nr:acyl-CoA N-acyltransferase [Zopfia rhizophila CBS 207.26]
MALGTTPAHPATMITEAKALETTIPTKIAVDDPLPDPIFTTSRLLIRPLHPQDAQSMQIHCEPASITKYQTLAFPYPYTLDSANNWIGMNTTYPFNNFGICELSSPSTIIGGIGIKPGSDVQAHTAEIGYWVGEPFWGKGYLTEALEAMTDWVFRERGDKYRRLWAGVFSGNPASMRCLEKCGYKLEGVMKAHVEKHGEIYDLHIWGLTRADWEEVMRGREKK